MLRIVPWWAWISTASALLTFAVYFSNPAHANPDIEAHVVRYGVDNAAAICAAIDQNPTVAGVYAEMNHVYQTSDLNSFQTGEAVTIAVQTGCQRHMRLLVRFANTADPSGDQIL